MGWLSNNWMFLALAVCVLILVALFGRSGRTAHADGAARCCDGMKKDKETS